jgi:nitrite reductase/ring-hydroxylating ferredoxin subunit
MTERWFPLSRSEEVVPRHVVHAQLLGQELALWRDDVGHVNVWENRCPHRGVRLSIGFNMGPELRCQYHGWRYASGSGQCVFIPAHPRQQPAASIRATVYGSVESYGYVWSRLSHAGVEPIPNLGISAWTNLRSTFVEAPTSHVREVLRQAQFVAKDEFILESSTPEAAIRTLLLLQPVSDRQTLIHALLSAELTGPQRLAAQRRHTSRFNELRDAIEDRDRHCAP